jgi:transposase InsO family protein
MEERMRFVMAVERQQESFAAICRSFGVSRRVGYKWLERYDEEGVEGLKERSRAPLHHPQALAERIAEYCIRVRRMHPTWGPLKVRAWLEEHKPQTQWPASSTIGELFDREGLTVKRRLRRRSPPSSAPFAPCAAANDVWCIDFKGWFVTSDGGRCEPLTLSDAHSRYLLRCQALAHTDADHVWPVLDAALREFGLPLRLRSDNGPPFCLVWGRRAVAALGQGDQGRHRARAYRARPAATERPIGAAASDTVAGHRQAAGTYLARAA